MFFLVTCDKKQHVLLQDNITLKNVRAYGICISILSGYVWYISFMTFKWVSLKNINKMQQKLIEKTKTKIFYFDKRLDFYLKCPFPPTKPHCLWYDVFIIFRRWGIAIRMILFDVVDTWMERKCQFDIYLHWRINNS